MKVYQVWYPEPMGSLRSPTVVGARVHCTHAVREHAEACATRLKETNASYSVWVAEVTVLDEGCK